jgi:hypothetical protein
MSDDWIKKAAAKKRLDEQREQNDLTLNHYAEQGSPRYFARLAERVRTDANRYRELSGQDIVVEPDTNIREIVIRKLSHPTVKIRIELDGRAIRVQYTSRKADGASFRTASLDFAIWALAPDDLYVGEPGEPETRVEIPEVSRRILHALTE